MKLLVSSLMIFFGTLLLAALLALGYPGGWGVPTLLQSGPTMSGPPGWEFIVSLLFPS